LWQKAYPLGDVLQQEIQGFLLLQIKARRNFGQMDKKYREKTSRHEWEGFETHEVVNNRILSSRLFHLHGRASIGACNISLSGGIRI
jgi:hypothetical protein